MSTNDQNEHEKRAKEIERDLYSSKAADYGCHNHQIVQRIQRFGVAVRALKHTLEDIEKHGLAKACFRFSDCVQDSEGRLNRDAIEFFDKTFSVMLNNYASSVQSHNEDYLNMVNRYNVAIEDVMRGIKHIEEIRAETEDEDFINDVEYVAKYAHGINIENL